MRERGGSSPVTLTVERNHLFKNKQQQQQQQHKGTIFKPPPPKKKIQTKKEEKKRSEEKTSEQLGENDGNEKKTKKKQKKMLRQISVRTGRNIRPDRTRGSAGFRWIAAIRSPSATISTIFFFSVENSVSCYDWLGFLQDRSSHRVLPGFTGFYWVGASVGGSGRWSVPPFRSIRCQSIVKRDCRPGSRSQRAKYNSTDPFELTWTRNNGRHNRSIPTSQSRWPKNQKQNNNNKSRPKSDPIPHSGTRRGSTESSAKDRTEKKTPWEAARAHKRRTEREKKSAAQVQKCRVRFPWEANNPTPASPSSIFHLVLFFFASSHDLCERPIARFLLLGSVLFFFFVGRRCRRFLLRVYFVCECFVFSHRNPIRNPNSDSDCLPANAPPFQSLSAPNVEPFLST